MKFLQYSNGNIREAPLPTNVNYIIFNMDAEKNRRLFDGSGFVEWGKYFININNYPNINEGMWTWPKQSNILMLGESTYSRGISKTNLPIVNVNGYLLYIKKINTSAGRNKIFFPNPPSSPDQLFRQDLVFLECWHELITEKDWWCPYGNVQYGSNTFVCDDGVEITLDLITDKLGSEYQGYSAFGTWDTETIGYGKKWSELTDEEKISIISSKYQNIYVDGDNIVQVRYRIRVVSATEKNNGMFDEEGINPQIGEYSYEKFFTQIADADTNIVVRGSSINAIDYDNTLRERERVFYTYVSKQNFIPKSYGYLPGAFYSDFNISKSYGKTSVIAMPIALVSRRNTGAFHPVYNPNGSAKFNDNGTAKYWYEYTKETDWNITTYSISAVDQGNKQFKISGDHTDVIKKDYYITVSGSTGNDGRYYVTDTTYDGTYTIITVSEDIPDSTADGSLKSDFQYVKYCFDNAVGGTIESGISGRPDGLYADEINKRDVRDLRLPAKTDETLYTEAGATRVLNKYIANDVRGKEELQYRTIFTDIDFKFGTVSYGNNPGFLYLANSDGSMPYKGKLNSLCGYKQYLYLHFTNGEIAYGYFRTDFKNPSTSGIVIWDTDGRNIFNAVGNHFEDKTVDYVIIIGGIQQSQGNYVYNNTLLHCDIIGDPNNYPQSWKDFGVMGTPLIVDEDGNSVLPDASKTEWKLSRKYSSVKQVIKYSSGSFTLLAETTDYTLDSVNNTITFTSAPATTDVIMVFYETYCNALEPVANSKVIGGVSEVILTKLNEDIYGSALCDFLINKIPVGGGNLDYERLGWIAKHIIPNIKKFDFGTWSCGASIHQSPPLFDIQNTPAIKVFLYIIEKNGLLYPVFVFKELKYDSSTSSWGDDNKFQITNYVSTMTDSNGKTILYGQKISKIPLGFAKNTIIDID